MYFIFQNNQKVLPTLIPNNKKSTPLTAFGKLKSEGIKVHPKNYLSNLFIYIIYNLFRLFKWPTLHLK